MINEIETHKIWTHFVITDDQNNFKIYIYSIIESFKMSTLTMLSLWMILLVLIITISH